MHFLSKNAFQNIAGKATTLVKPPNKGPGGSIPGTSDGGARAETGSLLKLSILATSKGPEPICPTWLRKPFWELNAEPGRASRKGPGIFTQPAQRAAGGRACQSGMRAAFPGTIMFQASHVMASPLSSASQARHNFLLETPPLPMSHLKIKKPLLFKKQQLHWSKQGRAQLNIPRELSLCTPGPARLVFLIRKGQPGPTNCPESRLGPAEPRSWNLGGWDRAGYGRQLPVSTYSPTQSYLASEAEVG